MSQIITTAAVRLVDREAEWARADLRRCPAGPPCATPGKPLWWDFMRPSVRDLADALIEAGAYSIEDQHERT